MLTVNAPETKYELTKSANFVQIAQGYAPEGRLLPAALRAAQAAGI